MAKKVRVASDVPRFWNVADVGEEAAELTLYGQIMPRRPKDWSGVPVTDCLVCPEDFLEDLKKIRDKARITVRINSVGGDLFTGMAIYTQLKGLSGHVTVVVDGVAASAASLVAMSGDVVKIPAGSLMMIHNPQAFICGGYTTKDLADVVKQLEATAQSLAETYAAKTGLSTSELREMMTAETWMNGKEAVEKGFADEVLFETSAQVSVTEDRQTMIANGVAQPLDGFMNVPGLPVVQVAMVAKDEETGVDARKSEEGEVVMTTVEELRAAHPELVAQVENAAREAGKTEGAASGADAERERLQAIESIEASIGDRSLVAEAKYGEKKCTAQELAFRAMQAQAKQGKEVLQAMTADSQASGAANVGAVPNGGNPVSDVTGAGDLSDDECVAMIAGNEAKKGETSDE